MNAKQAAKLETIIEKLEALQSEVSDARISGLLGEAKSKLIKADVEVFHSINKN